MRSLCLVASYGPSLVTFRGALIKALRAKGVVVRAVSAALDGATREWLAAQGVECDELPLTRNSIDVLGDLQYVAGLWRLLRRVRPDAFLSYTVKPVVFGSLAARLAGIPSRFALISGRGVVLGEASTAPRWQKWLLEWLYRIALKGASAVIFQNRDDHDYFVARRLVAPGTALHIVAGSGVDLAMFPAVALPARMSFLMIARLLHEKGVEQYLAAAKLVRRRNPDAQFRLVGWFESSPAGVTSAQFAEWNCEGQVDFLGRLEDVRPVLRDCMVYVLPSYYGEGLPRTTLEAMATGRAIITTDVPGCRETVRGEGENGVLVHPRDVAALAAAMQKMIDEPDTVRRMAHASRQYAVERFDADEVANLMVQALGNLG